MDGGQNFIKKNGRYKYYNLIVRNVAKTKRKGEYPMSQYDNYEVEYWPDITLELVRNHPLEPELIIDVVFEAWNGIMETSIANQLRIGRDIFPQPQILGNYLHELIPAILASRYPNLWRRERDKCDKDLVYIPNVDYSVEIKTSSNPTNIYGNRSYGQENSENNSGKSKDGYYLTINFEKFDPSNPDFRPNINIIRFGWVDHSDWHAQAAATGQQATLSREARDNKLLTIYRRGLIDMRRE